MVTIFKIGDRVQYARQWLRSTGQLAGDIPHATGRIISLSPVSNGLDIATIVRHLYRLRYAYGDQYFRKALEYAVSTKRYSIGSIECILQQIEKEGALPPKITVSLPDDPRIRDLKIETKSLDSYDEL